MGQLAATTCRASGARCRHWRRSRSRRPGISDRRNRRSSRCRSRWSGARSGSTEPFCILPPESADVATVITAGCRDPFGFVPSLVGASVAVTLGTPDSVAALQSAADRRAGGRRDVADRLREPRPLRRPRRHRHARFLGTASHRVRWRRRWPRPAEPMADSSDVVYGASFLTMTAPDQRVSFLDGAFNGMAAFYPRNGCADPAGRIRRARRLRVSRRPPVSPLPPLARLPLEDDLVPMQQHRRRRCAGDDCCASACGRRGGLLHGAGARRNDALPPAAHRRARFQRPRLCLRPPAVVRCRQSNEPDPARRIGATHGPLQGAHALHAARVPRERLLRGPRLGLHRDSSCLVAVLKPKPSAIRSTAFVIALALAGQARATSPAGVPAVVPAPAPPDARAASVPATATPPVTPATAPDDNEGEPKLSLATEADRDAWRRPGFRMGLGVSYGDLGRPGGGSERSAAGIPVAARAFDSIATGRCWRRCSTRGRRRRAASTAFASRARSIRPGT